MQDFDRLILYGFPAKQATRLIAMKKLYKQGKWETKPDEEIK